VISVLEWRDAKRFASWERLAIIGTDCPGLNAELMAQAFQQLYYHKLVLAPMDGGYYPIGLRCFTALFSGISWGTAERCNRLSILPKSLTYRLLFKEKLMLTARRICQFGRSRCGTGRELSQLNLNHFLNH